MTIDIDATYIGTISSVMSDSAVEKGEKALIAIMRGDVEQAYFYGEWAARHGNCVMAIDHEYRDYFEVSNNGQAKD
jgi:hypothetical protein